MTRPGDEAAGPDAVAASRHRGLGPAGDRALGAVTASVVVTLTAFVWSDGLGIYDTRKELAYLQRAHLDGWWGALRSYWWSPSGNVSWYPAVSHSHEYAAIPETTALGPLGMLGAVMSPTSAYRVFVALHAVAALIGLFVLVRALVSRGIVGHADRAVWILGSALVLGPFVPQHVAIGYLPWATFWLLPIALAGLTVADRVRGSAMTALAVGVMVLEGGTHIAFLVSPVLLGWAAALAVLERRWQPLARLAVAGVGAGFVGAARILATMQRYGGFEQPLVPAFGVRSLIGSWFRLPVTWGDGAGATLSAIDPIPSWDGDVFVAPVLAVAAASAVWLIGTRFASRRAPSAAGRRRATAAVLLGCVAALVYLFAVRSTYASVVDLVDAVSGSAASTLRSLEKYPFRFAVPGFALVGLAGMLLADRIPAPAGADSGRGAGRSAPVVGGLGVLVCAAGLVGVVVGAAGDRTWAGTNGPADPRQVLVFAGLGVFALGLALVATRHRSWVTTLAVGVLVAGSAGVSSVWWGLGTSTGYDPPVDVGDAPLVPSAGGRIEIGSRTLTVSSGAEASVLALRIPPGDVDSMRVDGGRFEREVDGGVESLRCPARRRCTVTVDPPALGAPVAVTALAGVGLLTVVVVPAERRRLRGRTRSG